MYGDPNTGDPLPNQSDRVSDAWKQLSLVLSFFSRVDTKLSVILGINLGMLAMLATRLPKIENLTLLVTGLGVTFVAPIGASFWHIWGGYFPDLRGGTGSLIYFRSISTMLESEFLRACASRSLRALEDDILGQCWRNSRILAGKFSSLRCAYVATLFATIPWFTLVAALPSSKT